MASKKAAALGDNCIDIYPRENLWYCTGNVVDFGVILQRLGTPVSIISTTGNDAYGSAMKNALTAEGLDTTHLKTGDGPTALSYMSLQDKERIYDRWEGGVMDDIVFTAEDIAFAKSHDLVHSALWGGAHRHLREIHESGTLTSFDYADEFLQEGADVLEQTIGYVDYAFFSFSEDSIKTRDFLRHIVSRGPVMAVATLGSKGSLAWDGKEFTECGIIRSDVVNTIGAGDSYIAGFMDGVLRGLATQECMRRGARTASKVVSCFGPWPGADLQPVL